MEVDRLANLADDLRAERIDADKQALEHRAVWERVAARVPLDAFVRADYHERRLLLRARLRIPRDPERRVERELVPPRLDGRDAHQVPE